MHGRIFVVNSQPRLPMDLESIADYLYNEYAHLLHCDYVVPMEIEHLQSEIDDVVDKIGIGYIKEVFVDPSEFYNEIDEAYSEDETATIYAISIPGNERKVLLEKMFNEYKEQVKSFIESMTLDKFGFVIECDLDAFLEDEVFFYHAGYGLMRLRNLLYNYESIVNEENKIYIVGVLDYHF